MGMTISGSGGNAYFQQIQQQNQRHDQLNNAMYENRKTSQEHVVQSIQSNVVKQADTMAGLKEDAIRLGGLVNTFA